VLTRIILAAMLCLTVAVSAMAQDAAGEVPLVLGESVVDPGAAEPDSVLVEEGVPTDGAAVAGPLVEEAPPFHEEFGPSWVASCIDEGRAWRGYAVVDALFMQRVNLVGPLAVQSAAAANPGAPVITASDVRYPTAPGVRAFVGWRGRDAFGVEAGYLGIWSMHADARAVSATQDLALPGQIGLIDGSGFESASAIAPTIDSTLNGLEFNLFATRVHDGCRRHDPLPWRRAGVVATADWLLGIRWAGIDETGTIAVTALPGDPSTQYRVTTTSHLVGPQIGHRRRFDRGDWSLEGWAKAGLMASFLSQSQDPLVGPFDLVQVRGPRSASREGVGMIGDLSATLVRRLGDHWGLRAGYTLLWFTGVAPAADQWDFTDTPTSGTGVQLGTVFLHGATLGVEASW